MPLHAFVASVLLVSTVEALSKCPIGTLQGPLSSECYIYKAVQLSWPQAEAECMSFGGHLASIRNKSYNAFMRRMPNIDCPSSHWIGGNLGRTTANAWSWVDKAAYSYVNWATGQPASSKCMIFGGDTGDWKTAPCPTLRPFICKFAGISTSTCPTCPSITPCKVAAPKPLCDSGWVYFAKTKKCYKVFRGLGTVQVYNDKCKTFGATLTSVTSADEQAFVQNLATLKVPYGLHTWIGFVDPEWDRTFTWLDGTKVNYSNWGPGQPDGALGQGLTGCVHLWSDNTDMASPSTGLWNDHSCNHQAHAGVCSKRIDVSL
ncbi:CLEC-50 protein [Aphelenchoides avenae]|nr:CLEC-50 protein [Aphelenchus avenae]